MLAQNLDSVDLGLLDTVCRDAWPESITLEFKRDLPGSSDRDKQELLKDVCALANADGGDLVFGIEERDGVAAGIAPIATEAADAAQRRISQVLEAGAEPRIFGVQMRPIPVNGGYVLVARVPPSYLGPHSIRVNSARRFVMRTGTNISDLTFDQLRSAFDRTASLSEQARRFIAGRVEHLTARRTPKRVMELPLAVVHFVPISGLAGRHAPDLQGMYRSRFTQLIQREWSGGTRTFNLDGLVVYPGGVPEEGHLGYSIAFRNGAIEAVTVGGRPWRGRESDPVRFWVWTESSKFFRSSTAAMLNVAKQEGFSGPAIFSYALMHVTGYALAGDALRGSYPSDREHLVAPEVWIDNLETADVDEIARPLLDTLWQGFGLERCEEYDEAGVYKPRR
jgi:hypothetical protein